MADFLNRLRKVSGTSVSRARRGEKPSKDLPLDHQLTFNADAGEQWQFRDERHIYINDVDVEDLVRENEKDIGLLCGVCESLDQYKRFVESRPCGSSSKFNAVVYGIQDKVLRKLGKIYETLSCGVSFEMDDEGCWVNNVNVRSVLNLYRLRPTQKARSYLSSIRDKLGLILSGNGHSHFCYGLSTRIERLLAEVNLALEYIPADAPLCLGSGRVNN